MENNRWTAFLIIFAMIILGSWMVVDSQTQQSALEESVRHATIFGDHEDIRDIYIAPLSGRGAVHLGLSDNGWIVGNYQSAVAAEPAPVERLLEVLRTPTEGTIQAMKETSWGRYGVGAERGISILYGPPAAAATGTRVVIGDALENAQGTYVRLETQRASEVLPNYTYHIEPSIRHLVEGRLTESAWRSKFVVRVDAKAIDSIEVTDPSGLLKLTLGEGSSWSVERDGGPVGVDPAVVDAVVRGLASMRASTFGDDTDDAAKLKEMGFDAPRFKVVLGRGQLASPLTIAIGAETSPDSNEYFARNTDEPTHVYIVSGYYLNNAIYPYLNQIAAAVLAAEKANPAPPEAAPEAAPAAAPAAEPAPAKAE